MEKARRVQMDLLPGSFDRMKRLKDLVEAGSYTEVVKDALRIYEYFVERDIAGDEVVLRDKEGNTSVVKLFVH